MDIEDLDNITLNVKYKISLLQHIFVPFLIKAQDRDGGDANLEVSDIRRSSLSQLTREGDIDRVRRFLDFSGDESLTVINKLDGSKVMTNLF